MTRLEPKAPPLSRNRAAAVFAAPGALLPTLALSLVFLALPGTVSAVEPQPDAAPQAPSVAPDPAPEARTTTPQQQSTPPPPVAQVAPETPAITQQPSTPAATTPSAAAPRPTSPEPKADSKPKPVHRETTASRPQRRAEPADPSLLLRVKSFLPGVQGDEDSPSHLVLLAAGALLALLMASGSLLSVARREWPRQLR
jgi:outer membrane biosynthesis protein TonB